MTRPRIEHLSREAQEIFAKEILPYMKNLTDAPSQEDLNSWLLEEIVRLRQGVTRANNLAGDLEQIGART